MADSFLRCDKCGRESTTDFASSLRQGWEKCCGYTMRLVRTDQTKIGPATRKAISNPEGTEGPSAEQKAEFSEALEAFLNAGEPRISPVFDRLNRARANLKAAYKAAKGTEHD